MTTMTIKTFLRVGKMLPAKSSVLLRGDHGIGKSKLVRQIARQLQFDPRSDVIDRRCSQMTEGDMIGLPSTEGEVTRFNPPDWFKAACNEPKVVFLDELNRATPEVMQAAFQIVLDRELNGHKLHPKSRVYAAINTAAAYNVNEMDPALLDRFWVIDLAPTVEDWLTWGRAKADDDDPAVMKVKELNGGFNCAPLICDFIQDNEIWLDPDSKADVREPQVSRRSWEFLSDALSENDLLERPEDPDFYSLSIGFLGSEASMAFVGYAKSQDKLVTGKDVVDNFDKNERRIKRLSQENMNGVIEKVGEYVRSKKKLTDRRKENLQKFADSLPDELLMSLWQKLLKGAESNVPLALDIHSVLQERILKIFNIDPNNPGASAPKIPMFIQNQNEKAGSNTEDD